MILIEPEQGGSSAVEKVRTTWKHLGTPGAGVVSGVNVASAAGSDGWLGSPSKSAPLPGKMERGGTKGTTPASSHLFF